MTGWTADEADCAPVIEIIEKNFDGDRRKALSFMTLMLSLYITRTAYGENGNKYDLARTINKQIMNDMDTFNYTEQTVQ